jgi:hypothetical protein
MAVVDFIIADRRAKWGARQGGVEGDTCVCMTMCGILASKMTTRLGEGSTYFTISLLGAFKGSVCSRGSTQHHTRQQGNGITQHSRESPGVVEEGGAPHPTHLPL